MCNIYNCTQPVFQNGHCQEHNKEFIEFANKNYPDMAKQSEKTSILINDIVKAIKPYDELDKMYIIIALAYTSAHIVGSQVNYSTATGDINQDDLYQMFMGTFNEQYQNIKKRKEKQK